MFNIIKCPCDLMCVGMTTQKLNMNQENTAKGNRSFNKMFYRQWAENTKFWGFRAGGTYQRSRLYKQTLIRRQKGSLDWT